LKKSPIKKSEKYLLHVMATGMSPVDLWYRDVPSDQQRGFVTFAPSKVKGNISKPLAHNQFKRTNTNLT
jgi:hypothetical protein